MHDKNHLELSGNITLMESVGSSFKNVPTIASHLHYNQAKYQVVIVLVIFSCMIESKEKDKFNFICVSIESGKVNDREDFVIQK